jgi:hypothetical protein
VDLVGAENVRQVVALLGMVSLLPLALWGIAVPRLEHTESQTEVSAAAVGD